MDATAFRNEAATLFMAGHETTANLLAWAFYLLSQAPEVEARAVAEAQSLGGRAAGWDDLPRLPFLRAVVEETLRLYPPVPLLARQAQAAGRDRRACGWPRATSSWWCPGCCTATAAGGTRRTNSAPNGSCAGAPERHRHAYVPFSLGPRVCTGMGFGLAEAVIVLATLLPAFRLRLAPEARVFPVCRLTLRPGETLPMLLERR